MPTEKIISSDGKVLLAGGINVVLHSNDNSVDLTKVSKQEYDLSIENSLNTLKEEIEEEIPSIEGLATETYVDGKVDELDNSLASVAKSGSYNDLTNKPTIPSIQGLATEQYVDGKVATKQDTLVSGTNIKTINNQTILGSGNIEIEVEGYATEEYVDGKVQELDNELASVAKSGSYNDLSNKPTIPSIEGLATETYVDNKVAPLATQAQVETAKGEAISSSKAYTNSAANSLAQGINNALNLAKGYTDTECAKKQDTLVSGTSIKTINGSSILGSGDIEVQTELDYCTNEMVDALWGSSPSVSIKEVVNMVPDSWNGGKYRWYGVLASEISTEVPNFILHTQSWDTRIDVTTSTIETMDYKEVEGARLWKVENNGATRDFYLDKYQGGTAVYVLVDADTEEPIEEDIEG